MITVSKLLKDLQLLKARGHGDLPIIYASDDEGNSYHKVYNSPTLAQIEENIQEHNLEIVGFISDRDVIEKDCNCVCIN
jgi:hypothetical protein